MNLSRKHSLNGSKLIGLLLTFAIITLNAAVVFAEGGGGGGGVGGEGASGPEPQTWMFMLCGALVLGGIAFFKSRSKRQA